MSSLLRETEIRGLASKKSVLKGAGFSFSKTASERPNDIFLSHAHQDNELIEDVVAWFEEMGMKVYIDWKDPKMPARTNEETVLRIRKIISNCRGMLVLATERAINSRWVPWELGYSDATKGIAKTVILPVEDPKGNWTGSEYLRIYPSIHRIDSGWAVFEPGKNTGGKKLPTYFSGLK